MKKSERLDQFLVATGRFESRARARAAIDAGLVAVNGVTATKAAQKVTSDDDIAAQEAHNYVSRGALKLEAALDEFSIDPVGKVCLDLGASTGGFSEVLLRRGAAKIYAVDVGRGQLHPRVASAPEVINLEQTHAKDLARSLCPEAIDLLVCDVSFISLKKALPPALALCAPNATLIALVKPQFEVGPAGLGKGGIVKPELVETATEDIESWVARMGEWRLVGRMESPIQGGDGNREFLIAAQKR